MKISVRIADPSDSAAVTKILAASYPALMAGHYEPDVLSALLPRMTVANPRLLASGSYYLAISANGEAAGCGGWTHDRPGTGELSDGLGHVRHFGVLPDWAGRGVGRALFARCLHDARAAGITVFECYSSLNGEGFYRAMGFETVDRIDVDMGPGPALPSVLMRR